jgi:hypothetical protein
MSGLLRRHLTVGQEFGADSQTSDPLNLRIVSLSYSLNLRAFLFSGSEDDDLTKHIAAYLIMKRTTHGVCEMLLRSPAYKPSNNPLNPS